MHECLFKVFENVSKTKTIDQIKCKAKIKETKNGCIHVTLVTCANFIKYNIYFVWNVSNH